MGKNLSTKDKQAIVGMIITVVILAIPLLLKNYLGKKEPLDPETFCPAEGEVSRTSLIIDKSDAWGGDDIDRVNTLISDIYGDVPARGRLTMYGIVGNGRQSTEVKKFFDMCNPGSDEECNALYQNCSGMKRRYKNAFIKPLNDLAEELKIPGESSYSPLLETVNQVVDEARRVPLKMYIVSDMMENHYKFRFYNVIPLSDEMVKEYRLPEKRDIIVDIRYIQRSRHSKELERAVLNVWRDYFKQQDIEVSLNRLFVSD